MEKYITDERTGLSADCSKGQSATKSTLSGWVKSPAAVKLPCGQ